MMLIRNPENIKRPIIRVDEKTKEILIDNGYSPISFIDKEWIFLSNDKIVKLILDIDKANRLGV